MMNEYQLIKKYFPNGCKCCGGKVTFNLQKFLYKCEHCGAYVSAHRKTSEHANMYEPHGYLANATINKLRKEVNDLLEKLFMSDDDHKPLISRVDKEYFVEIIDHPSLEENQYPAYGRYEGKSKFEKGKFTVREFSSQKRYDLEENQFKTISYRTKTFIWLAKQLKLSIKDCKVATLDSNQLKESIKKITKTLSTFKQNNNN